MSTLAELQEQLKGYEEQLRDVEALLATDPTNAEYEGARDGLKVGPAERKRHGLAPAPLPPPAARAPRINQLVIRPLSRPYTVNTSQDSRLSYQVRHRAQIRPAPPSTHTRCLSPSAQELVTLTKELLETTGGEVEAAPEVAEAVAEVAREGRQVAQAATVASDGPVSRPLPAGAAVSTQRPGVSASLAPAIRVQLHQRGVEMALAGEPGFDPAWLVGEQVEAIYSVDGEWYPGEVVGTAEGSFVVAFDGYGDYRELVRVGGVRLRAAPEGEYRPVAAPQRHTVATDRSEIEERLAGAIPEKYKIAPEDDEATREKKRKAVKAIKSKQRFAAMDKEAMEKASSWKKFQASKGGKRPRGSMMGVKKESIFKTDDRGKVGVTGSGKGVTDHRRREKHQFGSLGGGDD